MYMSVESSECMLEQACKKDPSLYNNTRGYFPQRWNEYKLVMDLRDGGRVIYDGFYDQFCDPETFNMYERFDRVRARRIFSSNLTNIMEKRDVDNDIIAQKCDIKPSTVANYKSGRYLPSYSRIIELCEILDCSVSDLTHEY